MGVRGLAFSLALLVGMVPCAASGSPSEDVLWSREGVPAEAYAQTMFDQGYNLYLAGDLREALLFLGEAVEVRPDFKKAWWWMARIYEEGGSFDQASRAWERVVSLDPSDREASYFLERARRRALYGKEAWDAFERGVVFAERGDHASAEASFRRAVELNPSFAEAHYRLGVSLARLGRTEEAILSLRRCLELEPDHEGARWWTRELGSKPR